MDYSAMFNAGSVAMVQPHSESMEVEGHYASSEYFGSPVFTTDNDLCRGVTWMHAQPNPAVGFATPPPELDEAATGLGYAQYPLSFGARTSPELYLQGSSLTDTPLSSPSSEFATLSLGREDVEGRVMGMARARSPLVQFRLRNAQGALESASSGEDEPIPNGVKMPQRKGGMQLWQFLYSLLTDPENKYRNIIEWTSNANLKEFRILEPEAIAIWWGHHKNKPNMSYDKFSRSLRYYYERGLIRKIPGERFVYRFCIDPEVMYKHIGNSDARPALKPMPKAAKEAISSHREQGSDTSGGSTSALISKPQVSVSLTVSTSSPSTNSHDSVSIPKRAPPPYPYEKLSFQLGVSPPVNSSNYFMGDTSMRRCNSLETGYTQSASSSPEPHPLHMSSSYPNLHSTVTQFYYSQSPEMSPSAQYSPTTSCGSGFSETTSLPQPAAFEFDSYTQNYSSYGEADSTSIFNTIPATAMWTFSQ